MQTRTRRQKQVLDFIVRYIDSHGFEPSYQVIARHIGVSSKAGVAKHISALEEQGLLERRRENGSFTLAVKRIEAPPEPEVLINWLAVPAEGGEHSNGHKPFRLPQFIVGEQSDINLFAYEVKDGSLAGKQICEGDIVLVEERSFGRDGDCVVALIDNREAVMRTYHRDGARIELRSTNEDFETIRLSAEKVEILGVFRGLLRPLSR